MMFLTSHSLFRTLPDVEPPITKLNRLLSVHGEFISTVSGGFCVVSIRLLDWKASCWLKCYTLRRGRWTSRETSCTLSKTASVKYCLVQKLDNRDRAHRMCVVLWLKRLYFLGAFEKMREATLSFVTSVCPHGTKSPYIGWIFMKVKYFLKICREKSRFE
jgi:hypothetical protein